MMKNPTSRFLLFSLFVGLNLVLAFGCKKEEKNENGQPPSVRLDSIYKVTSTSLTCCGYANYSYGDYVTGVCWSSSNSLPTTVDSKTVFDAAVIRFESRITGLTPNTTYYFRAYANNIYGVGYSAVKAVTTNPKNEITVTDLDGNVYSAITIGTQIWMKENLKVTKYRNGDLIGTTIPDTMGISSETAPKYQWAYGGNEANVSVYGRLYSGYVVTDSRNVCPVGWHIPTHQEWGQLLDFVGIDAPILLKSTSGWNNTVDNQKGNGIDYFGFSALPSGYRSFHNFYGMGDLSDIWASNGYDIDHQFYRCFAEGNFGWGNAEKHIGYSIRCLKD